MFIIPDSAAVLVYFGSPHHLLLPHSTGRLFIMDRVGYQYKVILF